MGIFRWHIVMIFIVSILAHTSHASDLTELELISKITETPAYQAQQMVNEGDLAQSEKTRAQFQPQLEGQVNYGESKEDPLFQFSPVITVSRSSTLGVAQKLPIGVNAKIEGFSEQLNIPAFNVLRANRTGARLKLEMDLLSNFLGRRDGSEFKNSKIKIKVSELKSVTAKNSISQEMRKLYWSYMGIEESHKMADVLLTSAQKQLQEIKARRNSGAADVSDVARAEAQVSGRKTQLSVIEYQKAQLFQQLCSDNECYSRFE
jgi:outer membrane protein TolC